MKREHLYVARKHSFVWLSALCMLASAAIGTILSVPHCGWWIAAIVIYLLILLMSGDEMLYRTAVPVWMLCLMIPIRNNCAFAWIVSLVFGLCYTVIISGKANKIWLLPLEAVTFGVTLWQSDWQVILAAAGLLALFPAVQVQYCNESHLSHANI